jgi:hypothetical protein
MIEKNGLQILAEGINREHALVESHLQGAVSHAIRAGALLAEAKEKIPHGEWLPWLAKNCAIRERTAQTYMRLSRELPKLDPSKAQRVADLPLREAIGALAAPSRFSGNVWHKAVNNFLDVCQEILDDMKPTAEMSPEEIAESVPILARMIRDADDVLKESHSRRCVALRELGLLQREATA